MIKGYIYAAVLAAWLMSIAGVGVWQRHDGGLAQASKDQARFDQINADLTKQKNDVNTIISKAAAAAAALAQERDELKTKLETEHAQNQAATNDLRTKYAGLRLRFQSAQGGCRPSSSSSVSEASVSPVSTAPAECVIPDTITGRLRELTADADALRDNYRLCYDYVKSAR